MIAIYGYYLGRCFTTEDFFESDEAMVEVLNCMRSPYWIPWFHMSEKRLKMDSKTLEDRDVL